MALKGIKVIEIMGLAPGPLCGAILADFGASVTVIDKIDPSPFDVMSNGKRMLSLNLKTEEGVNVLKKLSMSSDVLIDTFRPGVMEKLGLGPGELLKKNPRLVFARLTGYGQDGIYTHKAGHDINYVAMTGVLSILGNNSTPPTPPINLLADFGGGSLLCALGIVMALFERVKSGKGQIVDSSMSEGAAYLASWIFKSRNLPLWGRERGKNVLDGGLACYRSYKTKDDKFMAVGALEPKFYLELLKGLQLSENEFGQTNENTEKKFEEVFLSKTQNEWCEIFDNLDACVTPVLDIDLADKNEHNVSRNTFFRNEDNLLIPNPAPKLSRTPAVSAGQEKQPQPGEHTIQILKELGYKTSEINKLLTEGIAFASTKSHL